MPDKQTTSPDKPYGNGVVSRDDLVWMRLRAVIEPYMDIQQETQLDPALLPVEDQSILNRNDSLLVANFAGQLRLDPEMTYSELDKELSERDMYPLLRDNPEGTEHGMPHVIHVLAQRPVKPPAWPVWPNIVLFIITIISVMLTGAATALAEIKYKEQQAQLEQGIIIQETVQAEVNFGAELWQIVTNFWRGWPYALGILLILVPHEMGHYLMMRRHHAEASLPYFLPAFLISPFGTFGAAIVLRESLKNRKTLLDVGAAGPLAGFVMAVPILFIGLATSLRVPVTETGIVEGNSLLYALAKWLVFGEFLPSATHDVLLNQLAWAGWTGLFVTALNMLPLGQLDGGHVVYSLLGDKARRMYWPLLIGMGALALLVSPAWLFFAVLLFFVGRYYAVPLDNITRLDSIRRVVGVVALVVFVLTFTPIPIYQRGEIGGLLQWILHWLSQLGAIGVALLVTVPRWMRPKQRIS